MLEVRWSALRHEISRSKFNLNVERLETFATLSPLKRIRSLPRQFFCTLAGMRITTNQNNRNGPRIYSFRAKFKTSKFVSTPSYATMKAFSWHGVGGKGTEIA